MIQKKLLRRRSSVVEQLIRKGKPVFNDFDNLLKKLKVGVTVINTKDVISQVKSGKKVGKMLFTEY